MLLGSARQLTVAVPPRRPQALSIDANRHDALWCLGNIAGDCVEYRDMVLDAALPANHGSEKAISELRTRLMAEHLGVEVEAVAAQMKTCGSLVETIETLRGQGKTLELLDLEKPGPLDKLIAENELLDPEHADGFFEPLQQRGLRRRWREGRARIAKRLARRRATSR